MKKFIQVLFLCLFLVSTLVFNVGFVKETELDKLNGGDFIIEEVGRKIDMQSALDGVVTIFSIGDKKSMGSGFSVEKGLIVTNKHVVSDGKTFFLATNKGDKSKVEVIYMDKELDIAILKTEKNIPRLKMGKSSKVEVGEDVYAIGTPISFNFYQTVTKGVVSGLDREISIGSKENKKIVKGLIQHDASINPGNSGGVLLNLNGEVIGINTLKVTSFEGLGFAIPIDEVKPIINKIIKNI